MSTITVRLTDQELTQLKQRYPNAEYRKTPQYALFQFRLSDCMVTAYTSRKVVFQGEGAELHASGYLKLKENKVAQVSVNDNRNMNTFPQCGSDEVGTGDYFGPVVVCAAYVKEEDLPFLAPLHIQDSKEVPDKRIRELGPILMKRLPHSILILDNEKYNVIHEQHNMVAIKCKLHNQAYINLENKVVRLPEYVIVDQFAEAKIYFRYLKQESKVIRSVHFETKAENKYIAVACASIIARYAFLISFDTMCENYHFNFKKGAGRTVDENIKEFLVNHSKNDLTKVAKIHFANTLKADVFFPN